MRFGVSGELNDFDEFQKTGYDYIELALYEIAALSDEEFEKVKKKVQSAKIPVESVCIFFNGAQHIVGPEYDLEDARKYTAFALDRAAQLGVKVAVFGSGRLRSIPDGFDKETAYKQLDEVTYMMGEEAAKVGITIVVEHLRAPKEDNAFTTFESVVELVNRVKHPNVKALVDFFHLFMMNEPVSHVANSNGLIAHAHVAVDEDRHCPRESDMETLKVWSKALKDCGYNDRLTIECIYKDKYNEIIPALDVLKKAFN